MWWANVQRDSYQSVVAANNYLWILMNIFGNTVVTPSPNNRKLDPLWRGWKGGALRVAPNEIKVGSMCDAFRCESNNVVRIPYYCC